MIFRPFYIHETGCAGYLLALGRAAFIAAVEIDAILRIDRRRAQAVAS